MYSFLRIYLLEKTSLILTQQMHTEKTYEHRRLTFLLRKKWPVYFFNNY